MSETTTLDTIRLARGEHGSTYTGASCLLECSNLIAAGIVLAPPELMPPCPLEPAPFGDDHPSISRVIRAFGISWNDALDDEGRQMLLPYAPRILCTATGPDDEETRAWLATDWLARVHTPAWLRLAGLEDHARALEGLARITDATSARAAQPTLAAARRASAAARDAARAAAQAAAWNAAWNDAWDAAQAAAWNAARAAAVDAARHAVAHDAWNAAWNAARAAAVDTVASTVAALQQSALGLLDDMIAVGRVTNDAA